MINFVFAEIRKYSVCMVHVLYTKNEAKHLTNGFLGYKIYCVTAKIGNSTTGSFVQRAFGWCKKEKALWEYAFEQPPEHNESVGYGRVRPLLRRSLMELLEAYVREH